MATAQRWRRRQRGGNAVATQRWRRQLGAGASTAAGAVAVRQRHGSVAAMGQRQQHGGGGSSTATEAEAVRQWRQRQFGGIVAAAAAAARSGAVLPPRVATVATKTLVATAMAGAQTTINNQLITVAATATETAMTTTIKT